MTGTTQDDYTDRYARRVRGMTTSEIRALFAVASRPEVVSLAGGSPYIAALPLDAVGEMIGRLASEHGHDQPAVRHRPGHGRAPRTHLRGHGALRHRRVHGRVPGRRGRDGRRPAGARPGGPAVPGSGRRGARRGADLRRRTRRVPGRPGTGAARGHGRRRPDPGRAGGGDRRVGRPAKFLYTIPTYQNPAGVTLTEERREQVLDICERHGLLVVEDDPYGTLSFEGEAPRPLRARKRDGILYVSTFSKTFAPGLRVGWILAPHAVREKLVMASEANILCPSAFAQGAVTQYLTTMPWQEQIKTYREIYRERRDALLDALERPDARGHHLDPPEGRPVRLGDPAGRPRLEGDDAARHRRPRRLRARHRLLRGRHRRAATCGSTSRSHRRNASAKASAGWPG